MNKRDLRYKTLDWARKAWKSESYLYHLARGDVYVDKWMRHVVQSVLAIHGDDEDSVDATLVAEYEKHLSMNWMDMREMVISKATAHLWNSPRLIYELHRIEGAKPVRFSPIHQHGHITDLQIDQKVMGG